MLYSVLLMPVDGRGTLKLMGPFSLMFSSVEKEFRNLAKMGPALKILYLSQCGVREARQAWRCKKPTKEMKTCWITPSFWEV